MPEVTSNAHPAAMHIRDWPEHERPREKLLARGASALSDAELLAILLRTGLAGCSVLQMAQGLLDRFGGLAGLLNTGDQALHSVKGLGPAKRAEMLAVMELAKRATAQQLREREVFDWLGMAAGDLHDHLAGDRPRFGDDSIRLEPYAAAWLTAG